MSTPDLDRRVDKTIFVFYYGFIIFSIVLKLQQKLRVLGIHLWDSWLFFYPKPWGKRKFERRYF